MSESLFKKQILPLVLTGVVCFLLVLALWLEIYVLNLFTPTDILIQIHWVDVVVGLTIYLKTSIDFAIYIGRLMERNSTWQGRVAIEIGTALGNALGTMLVLMIWTFFKEVRWLLALMILVAALVLFRLAEDSLEHVEMADKKYPKWFQSFVRFFEKFLERCNHWIMPLLKYIMPNLSIGGAEQLSFWTLFGFAFTVPFILGLDDFAGYVPLFSVVNVFGFSIGVFAGHMILNIFLYLSPKHTIKAVKNPLISFVGSLAFVGLGVWGLVEVVRIIIH